MRPIRIDDIKNIIRLFLFVFLPLGLLTILSFQWQNESELNQTKAFLKSDQEQMLSTMESSLTNQFDAFFETFSILKNAKEIADFSVGASPREEVEGLFLRMAESKPAFDQIRLLDPQGVEQIRVNQNNGAPALVPPSQLQDKSDRYYVREGLALPPGGIYVSDMDLNMENGQIETPWRPMIRIAAPIQADGECFGLLVVNVDAARLLSPLRDMSQAGSGQRMETFLVTDAGDYLYHSDPGKTFGFMFPDRQVTGLAQDDPALWAMMQETPSGSSESALSLYGYLTLAPAGDFSQLPGPSWHLLARTNLADLPLITNEVILGLNRQNLRILLVLAGLSLALAVMLYFMKRDQEQLLIASKVADNTHDAVLVTDRQNRILSVNQAFEKITGFTEKEVLGLTPNVFKSGKQSPAFYQAMWGSLNATGHWEGELWDRKKDGTLYPKALRIYAMRQRITHRVDMYIGIFHDMSGIRQEQAMVDRLRHYNPKTNLPNETLLNLLLTDNLNAGPAAFHLICFQIENFAALFAGQPQAAAAIQSFLKDVRALVGESALIAQTNENQFVVGLAQKEGENPLSPFLKDFFTLCALPIALGSRMVPIQVKAGIAAYPKDAATSRELLTKAALALHAAGRSPGVSHMFFDEDQQRDFEYKAAITAGLQSALNQREFHLVYQPQVQVATGMVKGAEALLRWKSPDLGLVSPADFIPIAEESQLMIPLGYWIIETAFGDLKALEAGLPEDFRLSINLSPLQFMDRGLIPFIIQTAKAMEIDLHHIEFEITETAIMKDLAAVRTILEDLHLLGITIAIDDFGTGFSSLSYLHHLPLNKLKVDRAFIKDYPEGDDGKLARVITQLGTTMDMTLLMEGAETQAQIDYLRAAGYDLVQGYYYSKPLDRMALADFLAGRQLGPEGGA